MSHIKKQTIEETKTHNNNNNTETKIPEQKVKN